ncbi:putative terminase small subunit [Phaeobacter piscinae]|uniref:Terminase small subunit n=1 Tax=Phaeobacter piscinae TaxID=1580596 RepID=A0ABM6PE15_9RHOB|nr:terminase small subunit [Phaeobacter piscinae]ATG35911.1 putative terminase small subunit [Phaeobacter piscinae]AUQ86432.1 putative terminase small subunit [Phaeobacter piscinae]AUR24315.1 putative terminase small subunit [Phaeobacter piscinae]
MVVKKTKNRGREVNRTELAEINGVSLPTVESWVRRGCPVVQRGGRGRAWQFNTAEVRNWREDDIRAEASNATHANKDELLLRKLRAETEQVELDLAKAREQVVPVDQFERAMTKAFGEVRAGLRNALPGRVARRLLGESDETKMKEVMLDEVDQILLVLSDSDLIHECDLEIEDDEEGDDEGADGE